MNRFYSLLVCLTLLFPAVLKAQEIPVYTLFPEKVDSLKKIAFSSLTDTYRWSDDPDSVVIPDEYLGYVDNPQQRYVPLNKEYRKRFFQSMKISETDKVFIYDYAVDILLHFNVKDLNLVAVLSAYVWKEDLPYQDYYYQIGFEFKTDILKEMEPYYSNSLLYVGKENPFVQGKLEPMLWEKMANDSFPHFPQSELDSSWQARSFPISTYKCESDDMKFFVQNLGSQNELMARRLAVFASANQELIFETTFYYGESSSGSVLNFTTENYGEEINQWTGQLFKNMPPVVFGFHLISFGCPAIYFLDQSMPPNYIRCDNRH